MDSFAARRIQLINSTDLYVNEPERFHFDKICRVKDHPLRWRDKARCANQSYGPISDHDGVVKWYSAHSLHTEGNLPYNTLGFTND